MSWAFIHAYQLFTTTVRLQHGYMISPYLRKRAPHRTVSMNQTNANSCLVSLKHFLAFCMSCAFFTNLLVA